MPTNGNQKTQSLKWTTEQQKEHRKLWINALRSGKYKQRVSCLHSKIGELEEFCCLGLACHLAVENGLDLDVTQKQNGSFRYNGETGYLPQSVTSWLGLRLYNGSLVLGERSTTLVTLNDADMLSFEQIADIIESEPEGLVVKNG